MSSSTVWAELVSLWKNSHGVPDLTGFWPRYPNLPPAERVRLLAWHEDCRQALAAQLGVPVADLTTPSSPLAHLPPLPDPDQVGELSFLDPPELDQANPLVETPRAIAPAAETPAGSPPHSSSPQTELVSPQTELFPSDIVGNRYRLDRELGHGAFGKVWLGFDLVLRRQVAIKVPLDKWLADPQARDQYLVEARAVARLPTHPHLVPVYDVGRLPSGAVYVVSEYVAGTTLEAELKQGLPTLERAVAILQALANALLHAHAQDLIHRDVKPANILIQADSLSPRLADFGLAIGEEDSLAARPAGTLTHASPEQLLSTGHKLDGRSDLYSLGVIAYQLFTGRLPFAYSDKLQLVRAHQFEAPRPPQELRPDLPDELERICLKLLHKQRSDRHEHAGELMDDLKEYAKRTSSVAPADLHPAVEAVVNPPGLRAFSADDAAVFLDLLPGQLDRDGLPESIAFWKRQLESTGETCRVGLVLGPSGSGKSSLVRAGVLPRLKPEITAIYLQATPDRTEDELLRDLRAEISQLPSALSLVDTFRWLRKRAGHEAPLKTVLVLDQFEQWLNAQPVSNTSELVQALRHCDGRRLQAVLMVRDDFGIAANRLLRKLEIPLVEKQTCQLVDLFDLDHARRVLIRLGRGYGALPKPPAPLSESQQEFCRQATELLAEKGQVVPVRLALFADLVKRKPWEPATLAALGGMDQVGAAFLEETLGDRGTNPRYREVSDWAQRVLRSLLPPLGTDIKGHQRTVPELAAETQLPAASRRLAETMAILDGDLRLITATETGRARKGGAPRYQLTHDYLVPALRVWLERKQRETRQGQAELLLAERTALWSVKSEDRHLPTLAEHLRIRRWTSANSWREPERKLLARAAVVHGRGTALALTLLTGLLLGGWWFQRQQAQRDFERTVAATVAQLETAQPGDWTRVRAPLSEPQAREVAQRELEQVFAQAAAGGRAPTIAERIARLAIGEDRTQLPLLQEALLAGPLPEFLPTREPLEGYRTELVEPLWQELRNERGARDRRLRAGMALAGFAPVAELTEVEAGESPPAAWTAADVSFVVAQLLASNPEFQPEMRKALRPVAALLLPEIERKVRDESLEKGQRNAAAIAVVDYAGDQSERLKDLLLVATPEQFEILYPAFEKVVTGDIRAELATQVATLPPAELKSDPRIAFGKGRANAATTLLRLGEKQAALKACDMTDDPEALSQFMLACRPRGVPLQTLLECLDLVVAAPVGTYEPQVRYALLIALGEYPVEEVAAEERERRIEQVAGWYLNDPSSTVHGACGWLLRQWGATTRAEEVERTEVKYEPGREWYTEVVEVQPAAEKDGKPPKQKIAMTFIVFPPGEYDVGSEEDEAERSDNEHRHRVQLTRPFAVLDREITYAELIAFNPGYRGFMQELKAEPRTAGAGPSWYDAVDYCRWLGTQQGLQEEEQCYAAPDSPQLKGLKREPNERFNQYPQAWPVDLSKRGYRLPTEAEWEVAARSLPIAGDRGVVGRTAYGFGSDVELLTRFGWYDQNSGARLHVGRERLPGLRGLWDMHGNVAEWCHDWYDAKWYGRSQSEDPAGVAEASVRVVRGGSWVSRAVRCRAAFRSHGEPGSRSSYLGFRVVRSSEP